MPDPQQLHRGLSGSPWPASLIDCGPSSPLLALHAPHAPPPAPYMAVGSWIPMKKLIPWPCSISVPAWTLPGRELEASVKSLFKAAFILLKPFAFQVLAKGKCLEVDGGAKPLRTCCCGLWSIMRVLPEVGGARQTGPGCESSWKS